MKVIFVNVPDKFDLNWTSSFREQFLFLFFCLKKNLITVIGRCKADNKPPEYMLIILLLIKLSFSIDCLLWSQFGI